MVTFCRPMTDSTMRDVVNSVWCAMTRGQDIRKGKLMTILHRFISFGARHHLIKLLKPSVELNFGALSPARHQTCCGLCRPRRGFQTDV